jgi:hypothetical protein
MIERVWTGLDAVTAEGWACVACGRSFRVRRAPARYPVGRSHTGSQVFACVGDCVAQAVAMAELVMIPAEALTAAGAALLAVLDAAGGNPHHANPDDLVAATLRAAAPLVVAAELRHLAAGASHGYVFAIDLRSRADELDPPGGARS